jgi:tetratricopeptide (TPR) repeat protein
VWLFGGINLLHRPAAYGGGADRALAEFEHAQALFAADTANAAPPRADAPPDWGRDEAWAWAGRAHMQLKDPAAAKRCYEKALELNPTNGWVRASLLPAAERALADTTRDAK